MFKKRKIPEKKLYVRHELKIRPEPSGPEEKFEPGKLPLLKPDRKLPPLPPPKKRKKPGFFKSLFKKKPKL